MSQHDLSIDSAASTTHPSLAAPSVPARQRRGFSEAVADDRDRSRPRARGLVAITAEVAGNAGPIGGLVSAGIEAVAGGGGRDADPRTEQLDRMWEMQRESQAFNLEYLALQESMQSENRRFSTMSNLMKARHDTAKSAISNIRV